MDKNTNLWFIFNETSILVYVFVIADVRGCLGCIVSFPDERLTGEKTVRACKNFGAGLKERNQNLIDKIFDEILLLT